MARNTIRADEWMLGRFKRRFSKRQWASLFGGHPVLFSGGVAVNPLNAGVTCPAITPTLGVELLVNPGLEGTYDNESTGAGTVNVAPDWNKFAVLSDGTETLDQELTTIHGGTASQKMIVTDQHGIRTAANPFTVAGWYQISIWSNRASGTGGVLGQISDASVLTVSTASTGAWAQRFGTGFSAGSAAQLRIFSNGSFNGYVDDASAKAITVSSMLTSLGSLTGRNGTYICKPIVADRTQAGMVVAYLDANNFVAAVVSRQGATAKLYKCISGTWTEVITGAITYGAAKELKVVISGTSYSLYYDNVQVGTTQTITNTLGDGVHGFNAFPGNSVGLVTANP